MTDDNDPTPRPEGLRADLPRLLGRRRLIAALGAAGLGAAGGLYLTRVPGAAVAIAADGSTCAVLPTTTAGPFPADGTNARGGQVMNVLTSEGVIRPDLRTGFAEKLTNADGVALSLDLALVDVNAACRPLAGHAIYLWQCDARGRYSVYDLPEVNYLRGVGVSDEAGHVRITTAFPGCYPGRWPHIHFEIFENVTAAISGRNSQLTSQLALPRAECEAVYAADPAYAGGTGNLARLSLAADGVFRRSGAGLSRQMLALSGDPASGFAGTAQIGLAS